MESATTVLIPKRFYHDHEERELPTPAILKSKGGRYLIDRQDPAFAELIDDAKHYGGRDRPDQLPPGLYVAARALLRAVGAL